jgi:tryptophanyl-tRNA synthetase
LAATWLALGIDAERIFLYRQSHIREEFELYWVLSCLCPKGLMNRAHAYKAARTQNEERGEADNDAGILMGLYTYPILMAADILLFHATHVPVGKDQVQHVEMARDLAVKFNQLFGEVLTLPTAVLGEKAAIIPGLDGRKMSKSYQNTIPLFLEKDALWKLVKKIKTNSQGPEEPKDPEGCPLFALFQNVATGNEVDMLRKDYAQGIGWGEVKKRLLEALETHFAPARERFHTLMADDVALEKIFKRGEARAQEIAFQTMQKIRSCVGFEARNAC